MTIKNIRALLSRVSCGLLGTEFTLLVEYDKKYTKFNGGVQPPEGRIYIQVQYQAPCTKTGVHNTWKGGKYYLSSHMTPDEIVKKAYVAFEAAVKHEIMEGFKVDGKILFNPHVNFEELLKVSDHEVRREELVVFKRGTHTIVAGRVKDGKSTLGYSKREEQEVAQLAEEMATRAHDNMPTPPEIEEIRPNIVVSTRTLGKRDGFF